MLNYFYEWTSYEELRKIMPCHLALVGKLRPVSKYIIIEFREATSSFAGVPSPVSPASTGVGLSLLLPIVKQ